MVDYEVLGKVKVVKDLEDDDKEAFGMDIGRVESVYPDFFATRVQVIFIFLILTNISF
jgi:hypothetical protein